MRTSDKAKITKFLRRLKKTAGTGWFVDEHGLIRRPCPPDVKGFFEWHGLGLKQCPITALVGISGCDYVGVYRRVGLTVRTSESIAMAADSSVRDCCDSYGEKTFSLRLRILKALGLPA